MVLDIIRKICYFRLKPEERYLIDILNETTISDTINYESGDFISGYSTLYKYKGEIIFKVLLSDKIKTRKYRTINGTEILDIKSHGWCKYSGFWSVFEEKFNLDYVHTQALFNKIIGKYYELELPIFEMERTDTAMKKIIKKK